MKIDFYINFNILVFVHFLFRSVHFRSPCSLCSVLGSLIGKKVKIKPSDVSLNFVFLVFLVVAKEDEFFYL